MGRKSVPILLKAMSPEGETKMFTSISEAAKEWGFSERAQALHGLAPKCKLINMHELINKSTNDYVTLLPCENGANVNNKG